MVVRFGTGETRKIVTLPIVNDSVAEGNAEGSQEALRRVALNLLREGMTIAIVSRVTGLTVEQVQQLAENAAD